MQIASAFGRVQDALSWFVDSYGQLAEWKASVAACSRSPTARASRRELRIETTGSERSGVTDEIALDGGDIPLPTGAPLLATCACPRAASACSSPARPGAARARSSGRSPGSGPTASEGAPSGGPGTCCSYRSSPICRSVASRAVAYPSGGASSPTRPSPTRCTRCRLETLVDRLDEVQHWAQVPVARRAAAPSACAGLLHAPEWLFLDEATSALDGRQRGARVYESRRIAAVGHDDRQHRPRARARVASRTPADRHPRCRLGRGDRRRAASRGAPGLRPSPGSPARRSAAEVAATRALRLQLRRAAAVPQALPTPPRGASCALPGAPGLRTGSSTPVKIAVPLAPQPMSTKATICGRTTPRKPSAVRPSAGRRPASR